MAHNIDFSNGRANIAYTGSRQDVWHKLGCEMQSGQSMDEWRRAAGLDWEAVLVDGFASVNGAMVPTQFKFNVRSDTSGVLGVMSDRFVNHQPRDILDYFEQYVSADSRFRMDSAGSLKGGALIFATAVFEEPLTVAGDAHKARMLMTTALDGSGSTTNKGCVTRVICNNTLDAAVGERNAPVFRTRHTTKFDRVRAGRELAKIAEGFGAYKAMGDAMAQVHVSRDGVSSFFRAMLDIEAGEKISDLSGRKRNQLQDLCGAYDRTVREGAESGTAWAMLNAVTRYVDHDRGSDLEKRFTSAQFGSGAQLKARAVAYLTDADLMAAVSAKTAAAGSDDDAWRSVMSQAFRPALAR
jgi:phage/plasmid-like protein (TIGR03299 family)